MSSFLGVKRYTLNQAAHEALVHPATVWRWYLRGVRGRRLRTVLIGGRRWVLASDLDEFLAAGNPDRSIGEDDLRRRADDAARNLAARGVTSPASRSTDASKPTRRV